MDEHARQRYARHIQLPELGEAGQQTLLDSHALIVGLGGLGSPVAMYLAAAGLGRLTLVDFDQVDLSNLQRQIIHTERDVGRLKVESAAEHIAALNPAVQVATVPTVLAGDELAQAVAAADVVVDCTDNFTTRFELNRACWASGTPLVMGAAVRYEGQVSVFDPRQEGSPCYQCLYKPGGEEGEACSQVGILAPAVGIIGSIQAAETLKLLAGFPSLVGRLLLMDARTMEWRVVRLRRDPACPICAGH